MKVGDYVRVEDGIKKISKYEYRPEYENCHCIYFENESCGLLFTDNELLKSSPSIIDLIEVGDYVNGYYVEDIRHMYDGEMITVLEVATGSNYFQTPMYEEDIKSIVTKEMYSSVEYRVENN